MPETIKLPRLHRVFQTALGWTNSHLHEFVIGGVRYSDPDPDFSDELKQIDEHRVVLLKALGLDARCFDYVYDFGDHWHHIVIVEDRVLFENSIWQSAAASRSIKTCHGSLEPLWRCWSRAWDAG